MSITIDGTKDKEKIDVLKYCSSKELLYIHDFIEDKNIHNRAGEKESDGIAKQKSIQQQLHYNDRENHKEHRGNSNDSAVTQSDQVRCNGSFAVNLIQSYTDTSHTGIPFP